MRWDAPSGSEVGKELMEMKYDFLRNPICVPERFDHHFHLCSLRMHHIRVCISDRLARDDNPSPPSIPLFYYRVTHLLPDSRLALSFSLFLANAVFQIHSFHLTQTLFSPSVIYVDLEACVKVSLMVEQG